MFGQACAVRVGIVAVRANVVFFGNLPTAFLVHGQPIFSVDAVDAVFEPFELLIP